MRASLSIRHRRSNASVRPVLRGTITITAGNLSASVTLPYAVDPNHAELRWLGNSTTDTGTGGTGSGPTYARLTINAAGTQVTAQRTGSDNAVVVSYELIPHWPGAFRILSRGVVSAVAAAGGTVAIPEVDMTKAEVQLLGWDGSVAWDPQNYEAYLNLVNKTTVAITRIGTSFTLNAGFQVVERN